MISPTGLGVRNDAGGLGHYNAPREKLMPNGSIKKYTHEGIDFGSKFPQNIVAPFDMQITRISKPNESYLSGIAFGTKRSTGRMWYFTPFSRVIGCQVKEGEVIGTSQSLQEYYGDKVTDHIHLQFNTFKMDPMFLMDLSNILKGIL